MSDSDFEPQVLSLQNRRLNIRNSRLHASPIPFTAPYRHSRRQLSPGLSPPPRKKPLPKSDDHEWESDGEGYRGNLYDDDDDDEPPQSIAAILSGTESSGRRRARARATSPSYHPRSYNLRGRSADGSAKYIDYLERQIADLTGQLHQYTSAASSSNHAAKMRKLAAENRTLRRETEEWENNFDLRVDEEMSDRAAIDGTLREAVGELENQLEDAEHLLGVAEQEIMKLRGECDQLHGVEEENRSLIFKIEALTDMLAESTSVDERPDSAQSHESMYPKMLGSVIGSRAPSIGDESETSSRGRSSRGRSKSSGSFQGMEDYGITDPIDVDLIYAMDQKLKAAESDIESFPSPASSVSSSFSSRRRLSFAAGMPPQTPPNLRQRRLRKSGASPGSLVLPSSGTVSFPSSAKGLSETPEPLSAANSDFGVTAPAPRPEQPNFLGITDRSFSAPAPSLNSLFAELAAVESDEEGSQSESESAPHGGAASIETHMVSTAPSSPEAVSPKAVRPSYFVDDLPTEPPSPRMLPDTFDLIAETLHDPTPLLVKALGSLGDGLNSPKRTFFSAPRKAYDLVGNVVSRSASAQTLETAKSRTRRTIGLLEPHRKRAPVAMCRECGSVRKAAEKILPIRNTLADTGPAWKRRQAGPSSAVGGLRKRSGSVVAPVEDGIDVMWLWIRFIIAIVVALGVAFKDGPGQVGVSVEDDGEGIDHVREEERERALKRLVGRN